MNETGYTFYLITVALTVLANGGNGNRTHYAVQLYLMVLVLCCTLGALGLL
jgi:hypothetical protein